MKTDSKEKLTEIAVATGKGLLSAVPVVGPVAAEWFTVAVPNRRLERIEKMVAYFAVRVDGMTLEKLQQRLKNPEFADLFEQSSYDAAKALHDDRVRSIAGILAHGFEGDSKLPMAARCLSVIADLDDMTLALFVYFAGLNLAHLTSNTKMTFAEKWFKSEPFRRDIIDGSRPEAVTVQQAVERLEAVGILKHYNPQPMFRGPVMSPDRQEVRFTDRSYELTEFGRIVIEYIEPVIENG